MGLSTRLRTRLAALLKPRRRSDGFTRSAAQFQARFKRWPMPANGTGENVAVLITPWMRTPLPFFSLECARLLAETGCRVTIVWDGSNVFFNATHSHEIETVRAVVARLPSDYRVLDVKDSPMDPELEGGFIDSLLYENAVRQVGGEQRTEDFLRANAGLAEALREHAGRVKSLLTREHFAWMFIPGGFWAASGIHVQICQTLGISYTTFDSGPGALFVAHDAAAAHFGEVARVFGRVKDRCARSSREREYVTREARAQLERRMAGRDDYQLQLQPAAAMPAERYDIIVPLNFRADTAALLRQRLFASVTDWLTQLLTWLDKRGRGTMVIRQHPGERVEGFQGSDQWGLLIASFPALRDRVRLVAAADVVNTYDLLRNAAVVLPFTSRVGIEAAIFGKPVVLCSHCYYEDCGFAWKPQSRDEYFAVIEQALAGRLDMTDEMREDATMTYFLTEKCLELHTDFTPSPPDFARWVQRPPAELLGPLENQDLLRAMTSREPLAMIRYERLLSELLQQGAA